MTLIAEYNSLFMKRNIFVFLTNLINGTPLKHFIIQQMHKYIIHGYN